MSTEPLPPLLDARLRAERAALELVIAYEDIATALAAEASARDPEEHAAFVERVRVLCRAIGIMVEDLSAEVASHFKAGDA